MAESTNSFKWSTKINNLFGSDLKVTDAEFGALGTGLTGFGSSLTDFMAKEQAASATRAFQKYSNTMIDLSNATAQDAITLNEIQYIDTSAQKAQSIQKTAMTVEGTLESTAAAAGVRGNSVNVSMNRVQGNAAGAEFARQREFKYAMLGFDQQRVNSAMAAAMQKNYSTTAGGSMSGLALQGLQSVATIIGAF